MSFGWSAGDIVTAIAVTYNLIQALDDTHGAAKDYREAVAFLDGLRRVLEPLQTFTDWGASPTYGRGMGQQVDLIKQPIAEFLDAVLKYEPSLGEDARRSWQRRLPTTLRKLQWHIFMTKRVLALKGKIESHMRILDSLMQRLTLDVVLTSQLTLPNTLRATFEDKIRPELVSILRGCLPPTSTADPYPVQDKILAKLSEHHQLISATMEDIKKQIASPKLIRDQIQSSLSGESSNYEHRSLAQLQDSSILVDELRIESLDQNVNQMDIPAATRDNHELLSDLYYLVFLFLGHFLKNLFLALSNLVQPSRALIPTFLARYNISFLDPIGRPPRVLPYEYFSCFKMMQAFIEHEFRDLPGSTWVNRGRYLILSKRNHQALNEINWKRSVTPGSTVAMSILVRKSLDLLSNKDQERCPEPSCDGTWKTTKEPLAICPACKKEVYTSVLEVLDTAEPVSKNNHGSWRTASDSRPRPAPALCYGPHEKPPDEEYETDDEDISPFTRVSQETIQLGAQDEHSLISERKITKAPGSGNSRARSHSRAPSFNGNSKKSRRFWKFGRVFQMLWTETAGYNKERRGTRNGSHISAIWLNEDAYSEIRRFVIVSESGGSVLCLAIHMYSGQATLKSYLPDPSEHSIIHTSERPPPELQIIAEDGTVISEQIDKDPIRVVSERGDIELLPAARINYSKIYVVEKDVRVLNIGMVHQNSMASLMLDSPLKPQKQRDVH
ncbi:hypothetical protein V8E51_016655 [Hyaloscypha variabilis]